MDYADVLRLVEGDESENLELKTSTGQRASAARTLSAMLNGQGGYVLFGVNPDRKIIGQEVSDKTLRKVTAMCQETIYPNYPPSMERIGIPETGGLEVLAVSVPAGNMKPYAYKGNYYVRSGSSTVSMPPERQLRLVLERAHTFDRWETGESRRGLDAIDTDAVMSFRDEVIAGGRGAFNPRASISEILQAMNLLDANGHPNRGAVALFGKSDFFGSEYTALGCHLVAVDGADLGEEFRDVQIVEDNIFSSLNRAIDFCRDHLHRPLRINGFQAQLGVEIPEEVIREALANAFSHRDYAVAGRIQVRVYSDRVEVVSPGGLPFGLTPADLYVPHGSRPWNPTIMGCMFRRGIVEQLGSGTLRMIRLCAEAGIGRPAFVATGAEVSCSVPRPGFWMASDGMNVADVTTDEATILTRLGKGPAQRGELADLLGAGGSDTWAMLDKLRAHGLIRVEGHGRGAYWSLGPNS